MLAHIINNSRAWFTGLHTCALEIFFVTSKKQFYQKVYNTSLTVDFYLKMFFYFFFMSALNYCQQRSPERKSCGNCEHSLNNYFFSPLGYTHFTVETGIKYNLDWAVSVYLYFKRSKVLANNMHPHLIWMNDVPAFGSKWPTLCLSANWPINKSTKFVPKRMNIKVTYHSNDLLS
jgi:hypothetical protein